MIPLARALLLTIASYDDHFLPSDDYTYRPFYRWHGHRRFHHRRW
jgi:hypothetical protein